MEKIPNEKCLCCVLDCKKTMKDNVDDCKRYYPTPTWSLFEECTRLKKELENFKKVDEEELDRMAEEYAQHRPYDDRWSEWLTCKKAFISGYLKAKQE